MASKFKLFGRWAIGETISNLVWSYWPVFGAPVVTGILAYLGDYSFTLIFLFCLGAFAMIALALNQFSQWQAVRTPANKVVFGPPIIGLKRDTASSPPVFEGMKLGVTAHNTAQFPIEICLEKLDIQIADRIPAENFNRRTLIASKGTVVHFTGGLVDLSNVDLINASLLGKITGKILYGRPGKLNYQAEQTLWIAFKFDRHGQFLNAEPSVTEITAV